MSSDRFSETTPADAPSYDGTPAPIQTSGTLSTGAVIMPRVQSQVSPQVNTQFPQGVPAPVAVQLSTLGSGIKQIGSPQQYAVSLSLSNTQTVQIVPVMANALNEVVSAVAPNVFTYTYRSRNINVATVSPTGLVRAVSNGQCEILVMNTRAANLPFVNATPSGTEGVQASLQVTVTDF
ncbi:MAG: Ig-like domain-containing protein [Candidatus Sulfotelmatobacter sp.]|jgi:hypothetical protein